MSHDEFTCKRIILECLLEYEEGAMGEDDRRELERHFRPEFLNRIDEIILFQRLGREQMDAIVKIQLARVVDADHGHRLGESGGDGVALIQLLKPGLESRRLQRAKSPEHIA